METPDKWIIVKITYENKEILYKVFATWYGGYLGSDSWKMNSGIKDIEIPLEDTYIDFIGHSGSRYRCKDGCYGTNMFTQGIINKAIEDATKVHASIEIMSENTNWLELIK